MTVTPIRVVIADDQRIVRDGLVMLVGLIEDVEIAGVAANGLEAVEVAEREHPDVVLMDLRMPEMDGVEATRRIRSGLPGTQVLVLTTFADDQSLFPALEAGARGYLTKDASAEEIEQAIRALVAGQTHLDPAVQQRLVAVVVDSPPTIVRREERISDKQAEPVRRADELPDGLTQREVEVLKLIAAGMSNAEIVDTLVVSQATVKTHINRIFSKTGVRDRSQAVIYAHRRGLGPS